MGSPTEFVLDCSACERYETGDCDDCVVAYLLDRPEGAVVFNAAEERAIRSLSRAGLLPDATFKRRVG